MRRLQQIKVVLKFEKETTNTVRYHEDDKLPRLGKLYIPKTTLELIGNPETIVVTITPGGDQ
jgi:hypothetical protein